MASSTFFTSWQLWEQMTFVLACSIVVVFFVGLTKLYWTNRILRKQEIIDAEKQARLTQMRKTGLHGSKRVGEIPFGVRAIQSGIEVEGIWISRSGSPVSHLERSTSTSKVTSTMTLVATDEEKAHAKAKAKEIVLGDDRRSINSMLDSNRPSPTTSISFERAVGAAVLDNPTPRDRYKSNAPATRPKDRNRLDEETLERLEGGTATPRIDTYIPTSSFTLPHLRALQRQGSHTSGSSAASYTASDSGSGHYYIPRSVPSSRNPSSSSMTRHYVPRPIRTTAPSSHYPPATPDVERGNPFDTPPNATTPMLSPIAGSPLPASHSESLLPLLGGSPQPTPPEPTFGPGDIHVNRTTRRVNNGFEILPAGTFGVGPEDYAGGLTTLDLLDVGEPGEPGEKAVRKASGNKLHKKSVSGNTSPNFS